MDAHEINIILDQTLAWSRKHNFKGYNKHDGLNSPLLKACLGWAKWPRIVAIQGVMRFPVNLRPMLLVPKTINPKGLALFALGHLDRHQADMGHGHLSEAVKMLDLLIEVSSERLLENKSASGCWGYPYPWQDPGFFAPPHTPNAVVTAFVCEAFLKVFQQTGREDYLETVGRAINFFLNDLTRLEDNEEFLCLAYMPLPMTMRVMDVSILIGAIIAQYAAIKKDAALMDTARRLVNFVVDKQTEYGAWYYTDPPGDSLIRHDNYHTGFILDALWRYMAAADHWQWQNNYEQGLKFYANELFNQDGSPRWMSDRDFPHDVHGAAQGLVSFSLAVANGYPYEELLNKIGGWAVSNLYHSDGRFYYRKNRGWTTRYTLLRWCNAWMFRGLAAWLAVTIPRKV